MRTIYIYLALAAALFTSTLSAKEGTYHGKYKMVVQHALFEKVMLEFLVNSKDEMKALRYFENDEWTSGEDTDTYIYRAPNFNTFGPFMPHITFGFAYGSDEDGMASYATIGWLGEEGEKTLTVLNTLTTYEDGPNAISQAYSADIKLYKWDKETKEYRSITLLVE